MSDSEPDAFEAAKRFVRDHIQEQRLEVGYDFSISVSGQLKRADTPSDVKAVLRSEVMTVSRLQDELTLASRFEFFSVNDVKAALRAVLNELSRERYFLVWSRLLNEKQTHSKAAAVKEWRKIEALFQTDTLPAAVLQSFIWSCKRKAIGHTPTWHMMPVIFGRQGTGKTIFVRKFTSPLEELAADNVLFTDLADRRSADIFRYAVVICDDLEKMPPAALPMIKSVMTAETLRRRRLMTSMTDRIHQQCMPIGTSNIPVEQLVQDETGNRRFVTLEFKDGGDELWEIVNTIDYDLLWRSVDPFGDNPIMPHRDRLVEHQARFMDNLSLRNWLKSLDFDRSDVEDCGPRGKYSAEKLRVLFESDNGAEMPVRTFSQMMTRYLRDEELPFCKKLRVATGVIYVRRPPKAPDGSS